MQQIVDVDAKETKEVKIIFLVSGLSYFFSAAAMVLGDAADATMAVTAFGLF